MNILITGGNGFIAKNIYQTINNDHNVYLTNRQTLDILDKEKVSAFFDNFKIDVVVHTAVSGGNRVKEDGPDVLINNLIMFNNLVENNCKFGSLIHFGSGAEFDRSTDIVSARESDDSNPVDYYGLSKKIIKRQIDKIDNFYNLRIFGCFGIDEADTRFIKSAIRNVKNGDPIVIHQNRYMDFIYVEDLCKVVQYYIKNITKKDLPKDVNLCYNSNKSLLDVANRINELIGKPHSDINIEKPGFYTEYTGDGSKLNSLGIHLVGLDEGLKRVIEWQKTSIN